MLTALSARPGPAGIAKEAIIYSAQRGRDGGLARRSGENAIAAASAVQWRANQCQLSAITTNYDCANAFAATKKALLETLGWKTSADEDQLYAPRGNAPCYNHERSGRGGAFGRSYAEVNQDNK